MKHAEIIAAPEERFGKILEVNTESGKTVLLIEKEYTPEERDDFEREKDRWIFRRSGSQTFLADSDSGEDATGYYSGYFDLLPQNAVFEGGKLVGCYLCAGTFHYSGRGRASFEMEDWGYPGDHPFTFISAGNQVHLFFFSDEKSRDWKDWDLLVRDPEKKYSSYIDF